MTGRLLPLLLAATALAAATVVGRGAVAEAAATCPVGSVRALIGGKQVCLRSGQACRRALDRQYHRYRFHCHGSRLARFPPPPASADLMLAVAQAEPPTLGAVRFRIEVTNLGASVAQGVTLVATVTGGTVTAASLEGGTCSTSGARVTCPAGSLASPGAVALVLVVQPSRPGAVAVLASVSASTRDPQPGNNTGVLTATVPPGDFVRGEGSRSAYGGGTWRFALDAWSGPRGEHPGGTFRIRYETDAGARHASGEVVCLTVAGNRAAVGGRVDQTDDGANFGRYTIFFVTDNASGPDTSLNLVRVEEPGCELQQLPELPLLEGNFVVSDTP